MVNLLRCETDWIAGQGAGQIALCLLELPSEPVLHVGAPCAGSRNQRSPHARLQWPHLDFQEAYLTAMRYGTWLKTVHGVKPKDIVAIDFMNSSTFIFLMLGLWSIGAVPALINYNLTGKPLTHSVRVSTAKLLIVDEELRRNFTPELMETFATPGFREEKGAVDVLFFTPDVEEQVLKTPALREEDNVRDNVELRDLAVLIYTSGTTGLPKPAIVSWLKCWLGSVFSGNWLKLSKDDRFFTVCQYP